MEGLMELFSFRAPALFPVTLVSFSAVISHVISLLSISGEALRDYLNRLQSRKVFVAWLSCCIFCSDKIRRSQKIIVPSFIMRLRSSSIMVSDHAKKRLTAVTI